MVARLAREPPGHVLRAWRRSLAAMQVQAALRRAQIDAPLPALMSNRPLREVALELHVSTDANAMLDLINAL